MYNKQSGILFSTSCKNAKKSMDITTDKQYFFYLQVQYNIVETRFSNCIIQHDKKNADMNTFLAYSSVKWKQASLQF